MSSNYKPVLKVKKNEACNCAKLTLLAGNTTNEQCITWEKMLHARHRQKQSLQLLLLLLSFFVGRCVLVGCFCCCFICLLVCLFFHRLALNRSKVFLLSIKLSFNYHAFYFVFVFVLFCFVLFCFVFVCLFVRLFVCFFIGFFILQLKGIEKNTSSSL